jgi:hypothetical protein
MSLRYTILVYSLPPSELYENIMSFLRYVVESKKIRQILDLNIVSIIWASK